MLKKNIGTGRYKISTYGWSTDLVEAWESLKECALHKHSVKVFSDNNWFFIVPYKIDYKMRFNTMFMSDVDFVIESTLGTIVTLSLREDMTYHSISNHIQFIHKPERTVERYIVKCTCGLDGAGLGGRHSKWCTFSDMYDIGITEKKRAEERRKKDS